MQIVSGILDKFWSEHLFTENNLWAICKSRLGGIDASTAGTSGEGEGYMADDFSIVNKVDNYFGASTNMGTLVRVFSSCDRQKGANS